MPGQEPLSQYRPGPYGLDHVGRLRANRGRYRGGAEAGAGYHRAYDRPLLNGPIAAEPARSDPEELAEPGNGLAVTRQAQAVPGHGMIAGGHRNPQFALQFLGDGGDPKAGAGNKDRIDLVDGDKLAHGLLDGILADTRNFFVVLVVERAHDRNVHAALFDEAAQHLINLLDIGCQEGNAFGAHGLEGGDGAGNRRGAGDIRTGFANTREDFVLADDDRAGGAAISDHIELGAGQDHTGRRGHS